MVKGWGETKHLYLHLSLGPFLAAHLFAGLLFQLHGQAQGLDGIWKEGEVVHSGSVSVSEAPFPWGRAAITCRGPILLHPIQLHPPCRAEKCLACWARADSALFTKVSRS